MAPLNINERVSVVLVEPESPGNIGLIARVMKNFGFRKLVVVNPRCEVRSNEALSRAMHARDILEEITFFNCLEDLKKVNDLVVATTSRLESRTNVKKFYLTPKELAEKIVNSNYKVALVFGRESIGLTRKEIDKCDLTARINTNKEYRVLNISHAVAIFLYVISDLSIERGKERGKLSIPSSLASRKEMDLLVSWMREAVDVSSKNITSRNRKIAFEKVFKRSLMRKREAYILTGFFRNIYECLTKNKINKRK